MKDLLVNRSQVSLIVAGESALITFLRKEFNEAEHVFRRIAGESI